MVAINKKHGYLLRGQNGLIIDHNLPTHSLGEICDQINFLNERISNSTDKDHEMISKIMLMMNNDNQSILC